MRAEGVADCLGSGQRCALTTHRVIAFAWRVDDRLMPRLTDADLWVEVDVQRVALVLDSEHAEGARRQLARGSADE